MFESRIRQLIDQPRNAAALQLAAVGVSAKGVLCAGFAIGMSGAVALAFDAVVVGLVLIFFSRLADGLEAQLLARHKRPTSAVS